MYKYTDKLTYFEITVGKFNFVNLLTISLSTKTVLNRTHSRNFAKLRDKEPIGPE